MKCPEFYCSRRVLFALNQSLVRLEELRNGRPSPFSGTEDLVRHYNCRNLTYASFTNPDMRSHLTDSEAWRVVGRLEGDQTQTEVAQDIGVSQSVISRIWNRFGETGSAGR
ncbi:uncharacterized protein TNCV_312022 [Trichonephila clavipes]|nr:uncharacterized protein TNCV_312022 [Trichonephila clavipes]